MADQTQRLEIATVKAEVGSNILYRFSNDAANAEPISTDSGNIQNLKQIIAGIEADGAAAVDQAVTDGIVDLTTAVNSAQSSADAAAAVTNPFPSVAEGLAATSGTGSTNRFFSVPGTGSTLTALYRNDAGSATIIGSVLSADSDAVTINRGKAFPLRQMNRGGVTSPASTTFNALVLGVKVVGEASVMAGKFFSIPYFQNEASAGGDSNQGLVIMEFDAATFATTGAAGTIIHNHTDAPANIVRTGGVQTFEIVPASRPSLRFVVTIDAAALPAAGTPVTAMASSDQAYSWIIEQSCYISTQDYYEKTPSIIPNGAFRNGGIGNTYFGDLNPTSSLQSPVKAISDATLNALGCSWGFELAAADTYTTGNFIEVDVSSIGHDRTLQAFASVLAFSADGSFDFGAGSGNGPVLYRVLSDNTVAGIRLTDFVQLSSTVRRYQGFYAGPAPVAPIATRAFRLGVVTPLPRAKTLVVTGLWLSVAPAAQLPSGTIKLSETQWPNWSSGPASSVGASKGQDDRISLQARVSKLESPDPGSLKALAMALRDPMHSIYLAATGDSITWGMTTTGMGPTTPRTGDLTDVRDVLTSNSWMNLLRRNFGSVYSQGAVVEDAPGSGYYVKNHLMDPTNGDPRFRFISKTSRKPLSSVAISTSTSAMFGRYVITSANNCWPEFDLVGDNITVVHGGFVPTDASNTDVLVIDALTETELGRFSWQNPVLTFGKQSTITFPHGKYRIQLRDVSVDRRFNFEGIKVDHKIRVANNGLIGTTSANWLPGTARLSGAISANDEFVIIMLGTNDRGNAATPLNVAKTKDNLKQIVNHVKNVLGKKLILMTANAVADGSDYPANATFKYSQQDVCRVIRDLADEMGVDFVDHYRPTKQALIDGQTILADGLHPNDAGHRIIFEALERRIASAKP